MSQKDGNAEGYPREEFGDAVFVLDETNTKVRVFKRDGFAIWIPKYFLLKEISGTKEPKLIEVLDTLKTLASKLQGNLSSEEQEKVKESMTTVRILMDRKQKG